MKKRIMLSIFLVIALPGCEEPIVQAVGQLQSDRYELVAEFSEPIVAINVLEGGELEAGTVIVQLDTRRIELRITEAQANIAQLQAVLAEQISGPRRETIAASEASLKEARIESEFRAIELARLSGLREQNLTSIESVDRADSLFQTSAARIEILAAQLAELNAGTRQEQIDQTNSQLAQAQARLASLQLDQQRHVIATPVRAIVDSLPFEIGERPRVGDVIAVVLGGEQAYARVYIPEPWRTQVSVGKSMQVHVDGLTAPVNGTVRRIANEATFTPYFALTERDRSRLSYVAEITLPTSAVRLPEGLPVHINFDQ